MSSHGLNRFFSQIFNSFTSMTGDSMKSNFIHNPSINVNTNQPLNLPSKARAIAADKVVDEDEFIVDKSQTVRDRRSASGASLQVNCDNKQCESAWKKSLSILQADDSTKMQMQNGHVDTKGVLSKADENDVKELKELLLLHLDLIQHQQQLLIVRDQHIKTLSSEKETLELRLERMERRLALLKKEQGISDSPEKSSLQSSPPPASEKAFKRKSASEHTQWSSKRSASAKLLNKARSNTKTSTARKREQLLQQRKILKKQETEAVEHEEKRHSLRVVGHKQEQYKYNTAEVIDYNESNACKTLQNVDIVDDIEDGVGEILRAEVPYYVPYDEYSEDETPDSPKPSNNVEIPQWRVLRISNSWTLEGTENLEDEVYIKRHQKPEVDEKRRKRWDIQRLREQKLYEKLKTGRSSGVDDAGQTLLSSVPETLLPAADDVQFIEVCEKIPVSVFGFPVPKIKAEQFYLPWYYSIETRDRSSGKHRGRPRRT